MFFLSTAMTCSFLGALLLVVLLRCSVCVSISRRDVLKVREEWRDADGPLPLPRLRLRTAILRQDVCVRVRLTLQPLLENETLRLDFSGSETRDADSLLVWRYGQMLWWNSSVADPFFQPFRTRIHMRNTSVPSHQAYWTVLYDCFSTQSGSSVTVSVSRRSQTLITALHTVEHPDLDDPAPEASVTVDEHQKRFTVRMQTEQRVKISLCYQQSDECNELKYPGEADPSVHPTVNLSFPFLVPCVCVQLWYTVTDAKRNTQCPLEERILPRGGDVLSSSSARVLGSVLHWEPLCPASRSDPSVCLCWRIHTQSSECVPAPNGSLFGTGIRRAVKEYDVSAVDKHPQMCVKFSLNGSHRVFCPFESEGLSEWRVTVVPGSLHLHVFLMSDMAAVFAAQLCTREGDMCESRGPIVSRRVEGGAAESELTVPFPFLSSGLCVQVWRADLRGRRILCPDFSHKRWGLIAGAAVTLLTSVIALLYITCYVVKRSTSVWRSAERPVLLVCSSNEAAHVTAVCSLASALQGELCMDVRLAQWAQCCPQSSLAQLGPVPWLYGQCQSVQKAGGLVLIAWSPDAHQAYLRWSRSQREAGSERDAAEEEERMCCDEDRMEKQAASSSIGALFIAALSCLWTGILRDAHGQGFGLVCFQSLNKNNNCTHIPKPLRCVRKYCLPKELSSLIQDLTSTVDGDGQTQKRGRCWPRLLSKALSFFASRQLAPRLEAALPVPDKLIPVFPQKVTSCTNKKTWRQKRRRSKVGSACSCKKTKTSPELL